MPNHHAKSQLVKCPNMMQIYIFLKDFLVMRHIIVMQIFFNCLLVKCHNMMQIYFEGFVGKMPCHD